MDRVTRRATRRLLGARSAQSVGRMDAGPAGPRRGCSPGHRAADAWQGRALAIVEVERASVAEAAERIEWAVAEHARIARRDLHGLVTACRSQRRRRRRWHWDWHWRGCLRRAGR